MGPAQYKFNMENCNPISTPMETKLNYDKLQINDLNCTAPCRNAIGCLMYAMLATRPDLSISINLLSRYQATNNDELWKCIKRVLRYVKGTLDYKLVYENSSPCEILYGYADADWASFEPDKHSTSVFVFKIFNNTVTWCTKKKSTVALSSTEAEYKALMEALKKAKWLKKCFDRI